MVGWSCTLAVLSRLLEHDSIRASAFYGDAGNAKHVPTHAGLLSGEYVTDIRLNGSSPHTRGFCQILVTIGCINRFIPAYAGLFLTCASISAALSGSSPHTRGFCNAVPAVPFAERFIPAYAGLFASVGKGILPATRFIPAYAGLLLCRCRT